MFRSRSIAFGLKTGIAAVASVLSVAAMLCLSGCGSGSKTTVCNCTSQAIGVSVAASATSVNGGTTVTLTATVANDSSNAGVTWSAPAIGTLSSTTALTTTYTAPVATDLTQSVTLTATSVADKTKSGSVTLTINPLPIGVSVAASSTTVNGSGTVTLTATVSNDSSNAGVTWTTPAIGALSSTTALTTTYTAPAATDSAQSVTVTATSVADKTKSSSVTLTINPLPPAPVAGSVLFSNSCGSVVGPAVTLTINTNPVQTTSTDDHGNFSFAAVPHGTFTITPSLAGTNAIFSPASQSVTVGAGGAIASFNAAVGYAVSGDASYAGTATGPIKLDLQYNCPSGAEGLSFSTTIPNPGPFTMNGAAPGNYTVLAWRDALSNGKPNAIDPTGISAQLTISSADATGVSVDLTDPAPVAFNSTTPAPAVFPIDQGVVVESNELAETYGEVSGFWDFQVGVYPELASSYNFQWSTDSSFGTVLGNKTFPATYGGASIIHGLSNGEVLYFRYQGVQGNTASPWSSASEPVTVGEPAGSVTVTGNVTFANAATGPLYVSFTSLDANQTYFTEIASPVSPQEYSIQLPATGNYSFSAFIDQNNDDKEDDGDIILISFDNVFNLDVAGPSATQEMTLQGGGNSFITWQTENNQFVNINGKTGQNYAISTYAWDGSKKLEGVELTSGPNTIVPQDLPRGFFIPEFSFFSGFNLLQGAMPQVGDTYGFKLSYSDGSSENVSYTMASVPGSFGPNPTPNGVGSSLTPTLSWADPANASSYNYDFSLSSWSIPGNGWGTFSSSIDSVTWGVDPTGGNDLPTFSLSSGGSYEWDVRAVDSDNNASEVEVGYYPGYSHVYLPTANPTTLGAATVGQTYAGTIIANNGNSSDTFTVTGLSDGLSYASSGGTLTISGTPLAAGTINFQVSVVDPSLNVIWGPVTYTISVGN